MSLVFTDRTNRLYSHQTSKEARQPAKPISEMGKLNQAHWDEENTIHRRQQKEWHDLEQKHREPRNRNVGMLKTDKISEDEENQQTKERDALRAKHRQQITDMKKRQHLAKERAISAGHGAQ